MKRERYLGLRVERGLFKSKSGKLINADVNGSYNILRLGTKKSINSKKCFNPIKIGNVNEILDVAYFKWQPEDIGSVSEPYVIGDDESYNNIKD